jgi:hypothetical protein
MTHCPLRLRLKPPAPPTGYVEGAWWPRSRDLSEELPALAEALRVRLGAVSRVAYAQHGWDADPRRVLVEGHVVALEGFRTQQENTVHLTGTGGQRISLLVVPPAASDAAGRAAMTTAAGRGNTDHPEWILGLSGLHRVFDDAEGRWEADGGHLKAAMAASTARP